MTIDEAKDYIREWCPYDRQEEIIEALSNSDEDCKWIPVSDKVPEDNGYYLTTTMFCEVYCDHWTEVSFDRQETVIAWMPLPKPYKTKSEEEE